MDKIMNVTIQSGYAQIKVKQSSKQFDSFWKSLTSKEAPWVEVPNLDSEHIVVLKESVTYIKHHEVIDRKDMSNGISVKLICELFPKKWKYPTLIRKVNKPNGIELDMISDRKINLTEKNRLALGLNEKEWALLKSKVE